MNSEKIRNWDGTRQWTPEAIHYPEDEEQIATLIQRALEDEKRIKAVGAALSWSDITDIPQLAIRFNKMDKVLAVDRENRRIRMDCFATALSTACFRSMQADSVSVQCRLIVGDCLSEVKKLAEYVPAAQAVNAFFV